MARVVRALASAIGLGVVFVAALVLGVFEHLNVPAAQRAIVERVNGLLEPIFSGRLTIERVGGVGLTHVEFVDVHVEDPDGQVVVATTGLTASISTLDLVRSLVGAGDIVVDIPKVSVTDARIGLDADQGSNLRIARAFLPRSASASGGPPGRKVRLTIRDVHVHHASVRGQPAGVPLIDAEVDDTDGSLSFVDDKLTIDARCVRWTGHTVPFFPSARANGGAQVHLTIPSPSGRELGLHVASHGMLEGLGFATDFTYDSGDVAVTVDVPVATPEQAKTIVPPWPLSLPVNLHADAHGSLDGEGRLETRVHASFGAATLDVEGPVTLSPTVGANAHFVAKHVDASVFAPSAPVTDLSAAGDVSVTTKENGAVEVHTLLDVDEGSVGTFKTPSVAFTGNVSRGPSPEGVLMATGKAALRLRGAPTVVTARLERRRRGLVLSFQGEANAPDLAQVALLARLGLAPKGRALAHVDGAIDLAGPTLDARLAVAGEDLDAAGIHAGAAHAEVHASGSLAAPFFDVDVAGDGVVIEGMECGSLEAGARVGVDGGVSLSNLALAVDSSEQKAHATATLVRVEGNGFRIEDAVVKGFGAPIEATVRSSPGLLYVRARTGELDLDRIARFTRLPIVRGGHVSLDVEASISGRTADGRVAVDISKGALAQFKDVDAHVELTLHGHQAAGVITASVADIGSLDVRSSSVQVGEQGPLSRSSWRRAWGAVDTKVHVDIPRLVAALPPGTLPFKQVTGALDAKVRVERDSPNDSTPAVEASVSTTDLAITGASGTGTWHLDGVDPTLHVAVDGDTGATALQAAIHDATGPIVEVTANSTDVPYAKIFDGNGTADALRAMPFDAHLDVPGRTLQSLPAAFGFRDLQGRFDFGADWQGAVANPKLRGKGTLVRGRVDPSAASLPADFSFSLVYDGARGGATLQATNRNDVLLDAGATVMVRATDVLAGLAGEPVPWTASAQATLRSLPLRSFQFLSDRQVRGRASGQLTIDRLHDDARATALLSVEGLNVGEVACRSAQVVASLDGHAFDASARIDQTDAANGFVVAHAHAATRWGRELVPSLDASQPAELSLQAKQFRAALLYPFVSGVFASLDGRIDADARVTIDPGAGGAHPKGTIKLSDGTFELATLGGEFADVSANVALTPDGLITLQSLVAHGVTGKVEAAATARLNGFSFAGATATVLVPKNDPIPVVFDGVQMGMLDGRFNIGAQLAPNRDALDVNVAVPNLHMDLPETGTHDVQALGDLENVVTGVSRGEAGFVEVPLDATIDLSSGVAPRLPIKISVKLGNDVEVSRGPDLDVRLQGEPLVTIADQVRVSGQIRIVRGTIDVNGKPFVIDSGTVTFSGDDPGNPQVVLTAEWTAQDQTRIYADFTGPLKNGKVTLRSDPILPGGENDIRSLLLFGTTESDLSSSANTAPVAGAAGGVATQPINRALSGVNRALDKIGLAGGISTKIDTSQANPRPEVEIQIARDISLQVAWVLGLPVPGSNPDTTYVTLDWRFLRAWSLEATRGDQGTSILDLVWQHRY